MGVFEVAKKFLKQDPGSLLNALCSEDCPLFEYQGEVDREQTVVVDRDWWLFRFVTIFLRDGLVPEDRCTALQLYREAAFWRLESLQRAIEETHLNLTRTDLKWKDGALKGDTMDDDDMFWKNKKNWWKSQAKKSSKDDEPLKPEWWMDYGEVTTKGNFASLATEYQGQRFGPLSTDPDDVGKITTGFDKDTMEGDKDAKPMLRSTWGYYR